MALSRNRQLLLNSNQRPKTPPNFFTILNIRFS